MLIQNSMKLFTVNVLTINAMSEIPTQQNTKFFSPLLISPIFLAMWNTCIPTLLFQGRRNGTVPHQASSSICRTHPISQNPAHDQTSR